MIHFFKKHFSWRFDTYYHNRHPRHHRITHILGDVLLYSSILVLTILSFVFSLSRPVAGEFPYKLNIDMVPEQIGYNESIPLTFHYTNTTRTDFESLQFRIIAPDTVTLGEKNIFPLIPDTKNTWHSITIPVQIKGSLGSTTTMSAQILGTKMQKNKILATISVPLKISTSPLKSEINLPAHVISGKNISGSLTLSNSSSEPLTNISPTYQLPKKFHLTSSGSKNITLKAGEKKTFELGGYFEKNVKGTQSISILVTQKEKSGVFNLLSDTKEIIVIHSPIAFSSPHNLEPLHSGQRRTLTLQWKNTSPVALSNVTLGISLKGILLDRASISTPTGFVDKKQNRILWTKNQNHVLKNVAANATDSLTFSFSPIKLQDAAILRTDEDTTIQLTPFSTFSLAESAPITLSDAPILFDVTTQISSNIFARYYSPEGDQLGRGPLPPRVNQETKYFVFLNGAGVLHPLSNGLVTAKLGESARWTGFNPQGGEQLSYNTANRVLTWNAGDFNTLGSSNTSQEGVLFELGITPQAKDIGKVGVLLTDIQIKGRDVVTSEFVTVQIPSLTTNLVRDKKAYSKGNLIIP